MTILTCRCLIRAAVSVGRTKQAQTRLCLTGAKGCKGPVHLFLNMATRSNVLGGPQAAGRHLQEASDLPNKAVHGTHAMLTDEHSNTTCRYLLTLSSKLFSECVSRSILQPAGYHGAVSCRPSFSCAQAAHAPQRASAYSKHPHHRHSIWLPYR